MEQDTTSFAGPPVEPPSHREPHKASTTRSNVKNDVPRGSAQGKSEKERSLTKRPSPVPKTGSTPRGEPLVQA